MRLFFFGDSICFGEHVAPHRIFVTRSCQALEDMYPSVPFSGYNSSISGNTTRMALERMAFDVTARRPDLVYVQFGLNDCNRWVTDFGVPRIAPQAFAANLAEIISRARVAGAREVLLGTNHPTPRTSAFQHVAVVYEEENARYSDLIRKVAAEEGTGLVDHAAAWRLALDAGTNLDDLLLADGIHLSVAGHELYLHTLLPSLERAFGRLIKAGPRSA